jgi:hypothetical protein
MRARKPSALTIQLKIHVGREWRPQLCHRFGSANWPISKPPRPNFYDNSCTDLVNPSRPAYSAPADDPAQGARSGTAQTIEILKIWQQDESYPRFSPVEL